MAKQMFLSPIVGDGLTPDTAYRSALKDAVKAANVGHTPPVAYLSEWLPPDPSNGGRPFRTWCLVHVGAKDLTPYQAVAGVHALPVVPLDLKVAAINATKFTALVTKLQALGIDTSFLLNQDGTVKPVSFRDIVRSVGQQAGDTSFSEDRFDVQDVA